ncbi:hypothetical protein Bca101_014397 [Brassica carinata]
MDPSILKKFAVLIFSVDGEIFVFVETSNCVLHMLQHLCMLFVCINGSSLTTSFLQSSSAHILVSFVSAPLTCS